VKLPQDITSDEAQVTLNVRVNPLGTTKPQKPTANIEDFATVEFGTQLVLSCDTPGAIIRYTLNDTCPCGEDALVYTGPITITDNMFIRIAAWTEAGGYSERLNLHITCNGAMPKNDISVTNVVDDTTITANVNLTSVALSVDGIIYVGAYKDGKLVSISRYDAQNNLAISIDKNNAETLKIMWWNNAMMPMCAAKEIALN